MIVRLLFLCFLLPHFSIGQVDTLNVTNSRKGNSYLSRVMINKTSSLGVFEVHSTKGRLSNSSYYVIDLNQKIMVSSFRTKNWSYLYSSWIDSNAILHLSKGWIFGRNVSYDLKTGEKAHLKMKKDEKERSKEAATDVHITSEDLYCTSQIVYWGSTRIYYDKTAQRFLIRTD